MNILHKQRHCYEIKHEELKMTCVKKKRLLLQSGIYIFVFSFLIRILYNITVVKGYYPLYDSLEYQNIALNMLHNHCYCLLPNSHISTVKRAPLWPIVIALIYSIAGEHNFVVRLFLCVVGSGTCALVYSFARDLFGWYVGLFAGIIAAIYPFLYMYDGWLYSESLYIFFLLACCYTLYHLQHHPQLKFTVLSGVLLGLISLVRPNGLLVVGACMLWLLLSGWAKLLSWRIAVKNAVAILLIVLAFIFPWMLRNYMVSHTFVPVAIGDGTVLLGAYNDTIAGSWYAGGYYEGTWLAPEKVVQLPRQFTTHICGSPCEVTRDTAYKGYALQWINSHVSVMPKLLKQHLVNIWLSYTIEADLPINRYASRSASQIVVIAMLIITPIILELAVCGIVLTRKRWREFLFIYLVIALTVVQCIVFYGIPRFRAPLEPLLILLGSGALWQCIVVFSKVLSEIKVLIKEY